MSFIVAEARWRFQRAAASLCEKSTNARWTAFEKSVLKAGYGTVDFPDAEIVCIVRPALFLKVAMKETVLAVKEIDPTCA